MTGDAYALPITTPKAAAERMPRCLSPWKMCFSRDRMPVLLEFMAAIRVENDVVKVDETRVMMVVREAAVDRKALNMLMYELVDGNGMVR